jgi:hypothetical protein
MSGYKFLPTNTAFEFDTVAFQGGSYLTLADGKIIGFYAGENTHGYVQTFSINTSTWAVTTAAARLEFDTAGALNNSAVAIDSNHFINFWSGSGADGYVQVFVVNTSTWAITTVSVALEFDTVNGTYNSCVAIDSTHFLNFWSGETAYGYTQVFAVQSITSLKVVTAAAALEFDTTNGTYNSCVAVDSTHFLNFWAGSGDDGYAQVFAVDTGTWAVTTAAASLEFDTTNGTYSSCVQVDTNHFLALWSGTNSDGYAQVFTVNTSTWAVTTASAALEFDTTNGTYSSCVKVDTNHFLNFWSGTDSDGYAQVFVVDTSTWAVTTAAASLEFDTVNNSYNVCVAVDSTHFLNFWVGETSHRYTQVFAVDTSTWAVTTAATRLEYVTVGSSAASACAAVDTTHFLHAYSNGQVGDVQVFTVDTSTWAVATAAAALRFHSGSSTSDIALKAITSNEFLLVWSWGGQAGYAQRIVVNTSTWAVTITFNPLTFDTVKGALNSLSMVDSTHFLNFWSGESFDGYAQVFDVAAVDTSLWSVTTAAARLEFDTTNGTYCSCVQIDSNHFINFWSGSGADGYAQVFAVDTSTWAVTTAADWLEFDTVNGTYNSCVAIDSNHFIAAWKGTSNTGCTQVFTVDTSTWAVTTANAKLTYETTSVNDSSWCKISSNVFVLSYAGSNGASMQRFEVNTSTWAITTTSTSYTYDPKYGTYISLIKLDNTHFLNFWNALAEQDAYAQVFTMSPRTYLAVRTSASSLEFDTANGTVMNIGPLIDDNHFLVGWSGSGNDGFAQILTVNTSTWAVTTAAASLEFDTGNCSYLSLIKIDTNHTLALWTGVSNVGNAQILTVDTSTWAVTTANSILNFATTSPNGAYVSGILMDANHVLSAWSQVGLVGVFAIDTSTWAVTTANTTLSYDTETAWTSLVKLDDTHALLCWTEITTLKGQVLTVDTTTWAVTTAAAAVTLPSTSYHSLLPIDSNHFLFSGNGATAGSQFRIFTVNTSTWGIVTSAPFTPDCGIAAGILPMSVIFDTTPRVLALFTGVDTDGYAQLLEIDTNTLCVTPTWSVLPASDLLEFDTGNGLPGGGLKIDTNHFVEVWAGKDSDAYAQVFFVGSSANISNMKTLNAITFANIKMILVDVIADVKTWGVTT